MGILMLILEIVIGGFFSVRLGHEAHDKGFSSGLFIFLSALTWFFARIIGNIAGRLIIGGSLAALLTGWLFAIVAYIIFYYLLSRVKDKEFLNEDDIAWKKRNADANLTETGKSGEK